MLSFCFSCDFPGGVRIWIAFYFKRLFDILAIFDHHIIIQIMSNPFEFFNDSEEEDKPTLVKTQDKQKRTHADKRAFKKQQEENEKKAAEIAKAAPANEALPSKTKESHNYRHMEREKRVEFDKKQFKEKDTTGHYHDRRSGTGREDKPRKAGGGYGNVGNMKDTQQSDKYVKEGEQKEPVTETEAEPVEAVEEKEPQPEKLTLEEYYKAKGVDLSYNAGKKEAVKKEDLKAEWIKKEKLTLISTKEDLKNQEKKAQQVVKQSEGRSGLGIDESDFDKVGFGNKAVVKDRPRDEEKRGDKRGGKKGNRPQFSAEDFPTL